MSTYKRFHCFTNLLLVFILHVSYHSRHVAADGVKITKPFGGATFPAGPAQVTWVDAGGEYNMTDLTTYQLDLIVGGNIPNQDSRSIQTLVQQGTIADGQTLVNISSADAQSIQNGFYLRMTSNTSEGGTVLNYSGRFTLIEMTGSTSAVYVQGASNFVGDYNVPSTLVNHAPPTQPQDTPLQSTASISSNVPSSTDMNKATSLSGDTGFDTAATVGFAIGGICVGFALVALGWWLMLLRRKHRKEPRPSMSSGTELYLDGKAELPAQSPESSTTSPRTAHEIGIRHSAHEMRADVKSINEPDAAVLYELEGDWTGWEMSDIRHSQVQGYDPTR